MLDGLLAFVMPRSVITGAKQHAEFRQRYASTALLIIDCEQVAPLFNVPTCVILWSKEPKTVSVLRLAGNLPTHNADWQEAQKTLHQTRTSFTSPTALGESPYLERITQGASIVPRSLWFVRPYSRAIIIDHTRPQLETDPQIAARAKKPGKTYSCKEVWRQTFCSLRSSLTTCFPLAGVRCIWSSYH